MAQKHGLRVMSHYFTLPPAVCEAVVPFCTVVVSEMCLSNLSGNTNGCTGFSKLERPSLSPVAIGVGKECFGCSLQQVLIKSKWLRGVLRMAVHDGNRLRHQSIVI